MNSIKEGFMLFAKIILTMITVNGAFGIKQKISFFDTHNCLGSNVSYSDSITNQKEIKNSKSFLVEYGVWRIFETGTGQKSMGDDNSTMNSAAMAMSMTDEGTVWDKRTCRSNPGQISKVQRIGEENLEADSITLYENASYINPFVVNNVSSKVVDPPKRFRVWAITGMQNWGIYNDSNFEEEIVCLNATITNAENPVVTLGIVNETSFRSIRAGCGTDSGSPVWGYTIDTVIWMTALSLSTILWA